MIGNFNDVVAQVSEELAQLRTEIQEQQRLFESKFEDELEDLDKNDSATRYFL